MKTKITKKIIALVCAIIISATGFAQIEKTLQQKQDEQGAALKKWFDSGEIIVDGTIETAKFVQNSYPNSGDGYLCQKIKINRILKGNINAGCFNLKTLAHCEVAIAGDTVWIQSSPGYRGTFNGARYLMKIKKVDAPKGAYDCENNHVYAIYDGIKFISTIYGGGDEGNHEKELYQQLHNYCGIKVDKALLEKKSLNTKSEDIHNGKTPFEKQRELFYLNRKAHQKVKNNAQRNATSCNELFISEYLCGQGNNKAIEIYNPTSAAINLANYSLLIYHGASYTPTTIALTGTISALRTHVVSKPNASSAILAHTNQTSNNLNFNGDECIVLNKATIHIDKIGEIGIAIGSGGWQLSPSGSTNNSDLRRQFNIGQGDTSWANCKSEWNVFVKDSVSNLGQHKNTCSSKPDPDLIYSLVNPSVTGTSPQYFEFDVTVKSNNDSSYVEDADLYFTYNTAAFGTNIKGNGKLTITNGSSFVAPNYQAPFIKDETTSEIQTSVDVDYTQSSWNLVQITTNTITLMHVKIELANCNVPVNINLVHPDSAVITSFYYTSSSTNTFDPFYRYDAISFDNSTLNNIPCSSTPQITSITSGYLSAPNSVIAGAWYYGTSYNESQLTINGSGFGSSLQPQVFMKNAVAGLNNSLPTYIKLDSIDITSWNDNQVVLNVPSKMLDTLGNYPGTGYLKVVKAGTADTAVSLNPITIPYILKNISIGGKKRRLSFAYHAMTDSIGHSDTSVYNFRFDENTVGNPSVTSPYCRQLLKTAIHDWACNLQIRYRIGKDTTIISTGPDGISYITFKSTLSVPTFVAETEITPIQCVGSLNYIANEADVSFKSGVSWAYVTLSPKVCKLKS